ncbi:MAG: WcaF family extracellular polysaccharide biosynthesis acetyltransferase [Thermomicrobiales bacterium]
MAKIDLSISSNRDYKPGKPVWYRLAWIGVEWLTLLNPVFLSSGLKTRILRAFGASIGRNVYIKPNVHVKHPWRLTVGDNTWLGERAWIDNLVPVTIGANACISQGAYLCTGNHDWADPGMGMTPQPIVIGEGAWVGAFAKIGPGVTVGEEAIVTLGSVLLKDAEPRGIYQGNPAVRIRTRTIRDQPGPATGVDTHPRT